MIKEQSENAPRVDGESSRALLPLLYYCIQRYICIVNFTMSSTTSHLSKHQTEHLGDQNTPSQSKK
jgi:hypothetical protein